MKGNNKIAFTAEAIALMRDREGTDKFSKYFVSSKTQQRYKTIGRFIPSSYLSQLFHRRVQLSEDINQLISAYKPQQIIELACGYSPRGLLMTQKNPKLVYIETDFVSVIERKKKIFKEVEAAEKIQLSKNHHLIGIDVIGSNLYSSLKTLINKNKRTLVVAETLNSYLNPAEFDFSIQNILALLKRTNNGAYLSHEGKSRLPGFFGKMLLFYRDRIAKTKSYKHFASVREIRESFLERGFKKVQTLNSEASNNIIYLARF